MWCILGLMQPHVADAKVGRGKKIIKKGILSFESSQESKNIFFSKRKLNYLLHH